MEELGSLSTKTFHINFCQLEFNVSDVNIIESLFVEICIPRLKNIIIGVIYRPPSQNTLEFVEKVNEIISDVTKGNKHCYITGDFNLVLLKH